MKCSICNEKAVGSFQEKPYCSEHFKEALESFVFSFIKEKKIIPSSKVCVAVSGGKDSTSLLNIASKYMQNQGLGKPTALCINEGIEGYRDKTIKDIAEFCNKNDIDLRLVSFKDEFGFTMDEYLEREGEHLSSPCSVCGVLRRYLLNKYARDFDVVCTGHNMDDEAQSVIMNLLNDNMGLLARQGYFSGLLHSDKFTKRVKPFYFVKEKEIMIYSLISKLNISFNACPYAKADFRNPVRVFLNEKESEDKNAKKNVLEFYLSIKDRLAQQFLNESLQECQICHEPSSNQICETCRIRETWAKGTSF